MPNDPKQPKTNPTDGPVTENLLGSEGEQDAEGQMGSGLDIGSGEPQGGVPDTGEADQEALLAIMREKGIRNAKELAVFVKDLERKNTEQAQDLRRATFAPTFAPPPPVQPPTQPTRPIKNVFAELPEDPMELLSDKEAWKKFRTDYQENLDSIRASVKSEIEEQSRKTEYERAYYEAQDLIAQDPEKFEKLRPKMIQLSNNPQFARASLRQIYAAADKAVADERKKLADEVWKEKFGDIDPAEVRKLFPSAKATQISTAGGGSRPNLGLNPRQEAEKVIKEAILKSDKLRE